MKKKKYDKTNLVFILFLVLVGGLLAAAILEPEEWKQGQWEDAECGLIEKEDTKAYSFLKTDNISECYEMDGYQLKCEEAEGTLLQLYCGFDECVFRIESITEEGCLLICRPLEKTCTKQIWVKK